MSKSFFETLAKAVSGDQNSIGEILEIYTPLINRYSMFHDQIDEDCRQYIMIRIALDIGNFTV